MNIPIDGFDPENLERVYLGEPVLVGEKRLPADVLSDKEYEVAVLAADDLEYKKIGQEINRSVYIVRTHLQTIYKKFRINSRNGLAGFFPIDPDSPLLTGKSLAQLSPRELEVIEGLSTGKHSKTVAAELGMEESTTRTHIFNTKKIWGDCGRATTITRVANGIRATYTREFAKNGRGISQYMGDFALYNLVDYEPKIREIIGRPDS